MSVHRNKEFIKIGGSKTYTVTLTIDLDEKVNDATVLRNAAMAANFLADNDELMTWVRKIEVK